MELLRNLYERTQKRKEERFKAEGRDPEALKVYADCCREKGYVVRPFMCRMSTTEGRDYESGMRNLPVVLEKDKKCWRGLDMWRVCNETKEGGIGKDEWGKIVGKNLVNYDVWVRKGQDSPVLCVADRKGKCRGVVVRYRVDERRVKGEKIKGDGDEGLELVCALPDDEDTKKKKKNKGGAVWKEGLMGLKVIDFWLPGVANMELQGAIGDATREIFEVYEDVKFVRIYGGAGPSMSGTMQYPMDSAMRRYMEMEENVKKLAMGIGFGQVGEERKPMGTRWVLEYSRDRMNELDVTMDDMLETKVQREVRRADKRKKSFVRGLRDERKKVMSAGWGGTEYVSKVRDKKQDARDVMDDLAILMMERDNSYAEVRTRVDGYRPMQPLYGDVRGRNVNFFDLPGSGKVDDSGKDDKSGGKSDGKQGGKTDGKPGGKSDGKSDGKPDGKSDGKSAGKKVDSPESSSSSNGGAAISQGPEGSEGEKALFDDDKSPKGKFKTNAIPKPVQEKGKRTFSDDENSSGETLAPTKDVADEEADFHVSQSQSQSPVVVEHLEGNTANADADAEAEEEKKEDVEVNVKSLVPSDEEENPHDNDNGEVYYDSNSDVVDLAAWDSPRSSELESSGNDGNENGLDSLE